MNKELINQQKERVKAYMSSTDPEKKLSYHNWDHVSNVLKAAEELMSESELEEQHREDILLAAVWHDADFANGGEGHEQRSAELAINALNEEGLSNERLERIQRLILSTKMHYQPQNIDEAIIKDADLSHLASKEYYLYYDKLLNELNNIREVKISKEEWRKECIKFLKSMSFHTEMAKRKFTDGKAQNILMLQNMTEETDITTKEELTKEQKKALKKERKKNEPKFNPEKGIETMFRVALRNHINLSRIADDKANTLISVNAIILSIVLSALFPKLDSNPFLLYPGIGLILVSITTIIMATFSTIPKTTHGTVSKEDVVQKRGNLLFFGNFHQMSLADYEWSVGELMKDGQYLYGSLTRDLYFLGLVLNRKYKLLRYAYLVFVIGLIVSIILFIWSTMTLASNNSLNL